MTDREKILAVVKDEAEQQRVQKAHEYVMQTNWVEYGLRFDRRERKDLTWDTILHYQPNLLAFTINARANTLPSPDNLRRWGLASDIACGLCSNLNVTLGHILCGCMWVNKVEMKEKKGESRFKWRHDCILRVVAGVVRDWIDKVNASRQHQRKNATSVPIAFVRQGQAPARSSAKPEPQRTFGELDRARDWEVLCDLRDERRPGTSFMFPQYVSLTSFKPDMIILSKQAKICIVWELTAPLEENIEKRHASKTAKYQRELVDNGQAGWTIHIVCGEIGAKGWVPPTFTNDLRTVFGLPKRQRTKLANNCAWVARQCSYVIWLNRNNRAFEPFPVQPPKAHDK